ncbi:cytochrome c-550 PedF [Sinirhodobacter ferrireducens]|uniref:Cytochrome c-550 PedF n=1 Tax=Paenirhodobacter ferrireducens TaxID=1215032 RepID=A0A443LTB8_9RHOB|nr:cytochrome c-550 PedF [Sinirhodobacter ferrireducens]RWR52414.1 cytochrome c-550 PedF [Sinirhodobacter ferrireducens]
MLDVRTRRLLAALTMAGLIAPVQLWAHGDVTPQPVNTDALPEVGEDWLTENPYRAETAGEEVWAKAVQIGDSGFNQNCARCHGLGAVSGGLAPDLRYLEANESGDEWFVERFQHGFTQNGTTKMPAFGEVLGQKAGWAIRTYIETRPEDGALDAHSARLHAIRDELMKGEGDEAAIKAELTEIGAQVATASGAPVADSAVSRAAAVLTPDPASFKHAAEVLTIGLSAAE